MFLAQESDVAGGRAPSDGAMFVTLNCCAKIKIK
jgi:hypothetical protein